ncbi:MAG: MFS transporter, partial [Actinobacteria bacterium]|nr:MFS transporter [Actinomycetota bacterium]
MEAITTGKRGFYGWWLVGAIFVVLTTTAGLGFYNASVILRSAKVELDASVTVVSGATALFFGVSGITGFVLAKAMDRVDIRWFYAWGAVIGGGALAGLRYVDSVLDLYVFFVVFGVAFATAGLVPSVTVVARWFEVKRSVALSIASTGLSIGGMVITPVVARLLDTRTLAELGPWMGLVWVVGVLPISVLLIRSWPSDIGLRPYGAAEPTGSVGGAGEVLAVPGATFVDARRTRFFRLLAATYAVTFFAQVGALAQLFTLVSERQSTGVAASVLSILALSSVCGRLVGGVVVTRVSITAMTGSLILLQGVALAAVALADSATGLRLAAALFGISVGNVLMLQPLLLADAFGVREYSRIYSFNQLFGTAGVAGGPFVLGVLRDVGDYRLAFLFAAGC